MTLNEHIVQHTCFHHREYYLGRDVLLRSPNIKAAQQRRPTNVATRCVGSLDSNNHTPCAHEPRIAEFIPPQCRKIQEEWNNLRAFSNVTLKRHECRAPFARFGESPLSKFRTLCDREPVRGRAALLRSPNIKTAQQRRPTKGVTNLPFRLALFTGS